MKHHAENVFYFYSYFYLIYLLSVTQEKEEQSEDSTVVEAVVVSEFNPQNWLAGWLAP